MNNLEYYSKCDKCNFGKAKHEFREITLKGVNAGSESVIEVCDFCKDKIDDFNKKLSNMIIDA